MKIRKAGTVENSPKTRDLIIQPKAESFANTQLQGLASRVGNYTYFTLGIR
jgi:hypothetical protein